MTNRASAHASSSGDVDSIVFNRVVGSLGASISPDHFIADEPEDDENDMLDLAFGLTETSRLGCQVKMTKELDGLVVKLPSMTRNLQASDFQ